MSSKQSHLAMIQGVVNRLSQNSFLLKGWSVILVSGLFALAAKDSKPLFLYLAYIPAIAFWGLDGYYLWQERLFRGLYDHVRKKGESEIDFSMSTAVTESNEVRWADVMFSKTMRIFHGAIIGAVVVVMLVLINSQGGK